MIEREFSMRLSALREKKGVSAREMSLAIGQNAGYINNIETGKSSPSLYTFQFICEYLGVTASEFFDTESTNPTKLNAIITDLKKLDDKQLETIATLVKSLANK